MKETTLFKNDKFGEIRNVMFEKSGKCGHDYYWNKVKYKKV